MSRFFSGKYKDLAPYVPGEQPQDNKYIKLNTNESPYSPSPLVEEALRKEAYRLNLYSDTECRGLRNVLSELLGVDKDRIIITNGSDEILNFAFMAFCDDDTPAVFADITYGFYEVFAEINRVPAKVIPLEDDLTIDITKYFSAGGTVIIANPNAPTGIPLSSEDVEEILKHNKDNVVVIDEAYAAFSGESVIGLLDQYPNLLITRTFSQSRSLAGARVGFGIGSEELIEDLNRIRNSQNPYNVSSLDEKAAIAAINDNDYYVKNVQKIIDERERTISRLRELGFYCTDSKTNFIFAKNDAVSGEELYKGLKERGVLVRHFSKQRIDDYIRVTVGNSEQMDIFIEKTKEILKENEDR